MKSWMMSSVAAAAAAMVLSGVIAAAPQVEKPTLSVPLRMTAFAVSMGTVATGAS